MISSSPSTLYSDLWETGTFEDSRLNLIYWFLQSVPYFIPFIAFWYDVFSDLPFLTHLKCWCLPLFLTISVLLFVFKVPCPPLCCSHSHASKKIKKYKILERPWGKRKRRNKSGLTLFLTMQYFFCSLDEDYFFDCDCGSTFTTFQVSIRFLLFARMLIHTHVFKRNCRIII